MKVFAGRFRAVFWGFAVLTAVAAMGLQAAQTHRKNTWLAEEKRRAEQEVRQLEAENHILRTDIEALEKDPYRRELELRKGGRLGKNEKLLTEPQ